MKKDFCSQQSSFDVSFNAIYHSMPFTATSVMQRGLEEAIGSSPSLRSSAVIKLPRLEGQDELVAELEKVGRLFTYFQSTLNVLKACWAYLRHALKKS